MGRVGLGVRGGGRFDAGSPGLGGRGRRGHASAERAWHQVVDGLEEIGEVSFDGQPTTSETPKRPYWRVRLVDGSRVTVAFESAGAAGKSRIAVEHTRLADADAIARWRATWKVLLDRCVAST